jgi:ribosome-associated toxin RatA of RatAB toxin-antitoxin module
MALCPLKPIAKLSRTVNMPHRAKVFFNMVPPTDRYRRLLLLQEYVRTTTVSENNIQQSIQVEIAQRNARFSILDSRGYGLRRLKCSVSVSEEDY